MKIIDKIEIKYFRSFDWWKGQEKVNIHNLNDLNIFSGSNDSWKSNVLRALYLFFSTESEISPWIKFDFSRDFSKMVNIRLDNEYSKKQNNTNQDNDNEDALWETRTRMSDKKVTIKIHFYNPNKQRWLPENFWISRIFSSTNDFLGDYSFQSQVNTKQAKIFLKSFQVEYIPAIKDRKYLNYLFEKLQNFLLTKWDDKEENNFKNQSKGLDEILKTETKWLFDDFLQKTWINATFSIPDTLIDFFRTLTVSTDNEVSLFDRWDWVQARFIPTILAEISKNSKKNVIWAFEEPENSYERKNIIKLRDEFIDIYSREKQIFITTHSMEFLGGVSSDRVSIYRVWKDNNNSSLVTYFNKNKWNWEQICDDLWIVNDAKIINELQNKLLIKNNIINSLEISNTEKEKILKDFQENFKKCMDEKEKMLKKYTKPILLVEDEYSQIYKIAYLKLKWIKCAEWNLETLFEKNSDFKIVSKKWSKEVQKFLWQPVVEEIGDVKIIWLFDCDKQWVWDFHGLKNNYDLMEMNKEIWIYKKRKDANIYALLLPVPFWCIAEYLPNGKEPKIDYNFVEIENLVNMTHPNIASDFKEEEILSVKVIKFCWEKSEFYKKLFDLDKGDFENFKPLFKQIYTLFWISDNEWNFNS